MISSAGLKSPELIQKIKSHEAPARCLEQLFDDSELQQLTMWAESGFQDTDHCQNKFDTLKGSMMGPVAHPQGGLAEDIEAFLREKLQPFMDFDYEIQFSFHRNFFPYGLHTDSGYDSDEFIYKQGIIPLEVDPVGRDVYTVIFKQKAYHSLSFPRRMETLESLASEDLQLIEGIGQSKGPSKYPIKDYYADQFDLDVFEGFEIDLPFRWRKGDMGFWDRSQIHGSSDFTKHQITSKLGLMWISRRG